MSLAHEHFKAVKHPHLDIVDGFRAIGILLIVWYHLWLQSWQSSNFTIFGKYIPMDIIPATGYIGVEIFFFITGFGLFYSYATALFENGNFPNLSDFVKHRFFRIVPSYYLAVILGIIFFTAETAGARTDPFWHVFTHLTFIHNFYPDTSGSISAVFWILSTEVQFYFIFPLLAWCFIRKPWITFLIMTVCAYIFRLHNISNLDTIEFSLRQLPAFLDIYGCGMMTAYLLVFLRNKLPDINLRKIISSIMALVSIGLFFFALNSLNFIQVNQPGGRFIWLSYYRLPLGLLFMLLIISMAFSYKIIQWIFNNKLLIFLSIISYNLFLWHYLIIMELKVRNFPPAATSNPLDDPIWKLKFIALSLILSIAVATFLTYLFERPIIKRFIK